MIPFNVIRTTQEAITLAELPALQIQSGKMDAHLIQIGVYAVILLFLLLTFGVIITRLYKRASKQIGFVRTGFGGEKVVMNGGARWFCLCCMRPCR